MSLFQEKFSVAPMMDWTDRHCRFFHRLLSKKAVLYTEMVTAQAIMHGDRDHLLSFHNSEHPVILQIGGSDIDLCVHAGERAQAYGYDAINLNVGCPSDRVQSGAFGACLMQKADLVAEIVHHIQAKISIPVTVKCRLGVDDQDPSEVLPNFIQKISDAGAKHVIIHARKAWLKGLSPKDNRTIPPLDYNLVYHIIKQFPHLYISINGGVTNIEQAKTHLQYVDGVMMGRSAYHQPDLLRHIDSEIYDTQEPPISYETLIQEMIHYIEYEMPKGTKFYSIAKHMLGLFHGQKGARKWRHILTEKGHKENAKPCLLWEAFDHICLA